MADEVSVSIAFSFEKGGGVVTRSESFNADVAGDAFIHAVQEVGFGARELLVEAADVGTAAWFFVKNMDGTNFVTISGGGPLDLKLLAGESCVFRSIAASGVSALADTAACDVEYIIVEL